MRFTSSPYQYRRRLPHYQSDDRALFVTFHTVGFFPLSDAARDLAFKCCLYVHKKTAWLHAFIVMPEHVHLLMSPLRDGRGELIPIRSVLRTIKGVSARRINQLSGRRGAIWDEESFDHVLRNDESLEQKREYIIQNPVRRGLVSKPDQYKWLWVNPYDEI